MVFPAELRRELGIRDGDRFLLRVEPDGSLRLISLREQIRKMEGMLKHLAPEKNMTDELLADRRREAQNE